jgi:hypothetical protein
MSGSAPTRPMSCTSEREQFGLGRASTSECLAAGCCCCCSFMSLPHSEWRLQRCPHCAHWVGLPALSSKRRGWCAERCGCVDLAANLCVWGTWRWRSLQELAQERVRFEEQGTGLVGIDIAVCRGTDSVV